MDEPCRSRRGEGYGVCADAVVSKCALRGEKRALRGEKRALRGEKRGRLPVSRKPPSGLNCAAAASVSGNPPVQTVLSSALPAAPFPELRPPE